MAACISQQSNSNSSSPSLTYSPVPDGSGYQEVTGLRFSSNTVTPNHQVDTPMMSRTFPGDKLISKYTPSLAVTRTGLKNQQKIHQMSIDLNYDDSNNHVGFNTESEHTPANTRSAFRIQKPIPPIKSPRMDSTNREPSIRRVAQVSLHEPHPVVYPPRSKYDMRTGFWKTVTRPTPGELSLKYHKLREAERLRRDNSSQNIEDPDVLSTNFVLSMLEDRLDGEQPANVRSANCLDNSCLPGNFHEQEDSKNNNPFNNRKSSGTLYDHKQRLQAIRSYECNNEKEETDEKHLNPQEDQQTALQRLAFRLNSPTALHKHNKTFCGECIPDMASSRLLVALDSYQRTNSRERTNQSITSNVEAAHSNDSSNSITKFNSYREKTSQPEILVKFEDGPDSLKTIRLPENLPLARYKHRTPEALLKLSLRQSKRFAKETSLFTDQEDEKDDDSYPGFFTFSTTVKPVRTPANTPIPPEIENDDISQSTNLPKQNKSHVVNVAAHGKGALIIQHHRHLNTAKLDVFLPQVKMGKQ